MNNGAELKNREVLKNGEVLKNREVLKNHDVLEKSKSRLEKDALEKFRRMYII